MASSYGRPVKGPYIDYSVPNLVKTPQRQAIPAMKHNRNISAQMIERYRSFQSLENPINAIPFRRQRGKNLK
jgi:hypothetical protein